MKIGKDGRAVMRNWCFGTDLWILELVHRSRYLSNKANAVHVYSRGLL